MSPPPPANFEALADQSRTLLSVFIAGGHEAVAPPIIQPAGVFLDVLGEALRGRTYVFSDPDGQELCLRPDLTVPTCRLYLERHPRADRQAHYCYNGPAFRYQPAGADAAHPREFRQAGIEAFGATDREDADARTLTLVLLALQQSGLRSWKLRMGDLGLFAALLEGAEMPERWRRRLRHQFWRPDAFRAELRRLTTNPARLSASLPRGLIEALNPDDPARAESLVAAAARQGRHRGVRRALGARDHRRHAGDRGGRQGKAAAAIDRRLDRRLPRGEVLRRSGPRKAACADRQAAGTFRGRHRRVRTPQRVAERERRDSCRRCHSPASSAQRRLLQRLRVRGAGTLARRREPRRGRRALRRPVARGRRAARRAGRRRRDPHRAAPRRRVRGKA